jgi:hypothetical protein
MYGITSFTGKVMDIKKYSAEIFKIKTEEEFNRLALQAFSHQKENCKVYREYLQLIGKESFQPQHASEIPFLPIKLFKSRQIISKAPSSAATFIVASKNLPANNLRITKKKDSHSCLHAADNSVIFTSSATTGMIPSKHYVTDIKLYEKDFLKGFEYFYGNIKNYNILALLPSYLERKGSSLVYMADRLIKKVRESGGEGDFYLYNYEKLLKDLTRLCGGTTSCSQKSDYPKSNYLKSKSAQTGKNNKERKTILLGVSFALLDFVKFLKAKSSDSDADLQSLPTGNISKNHNIFPFENLIVMETGGMKGRGKELSRNELHTALSKGFGFSQNACGANPIHSASHIHSANHIHSEYGMAELLSQAYSTGDGIFQTPPWMKIYTRDLMDPFKITEKTGGINIIDLANINSCCFIETEDRGTVTTRNNHCISRKASTCTKTLSTETNCTFTIDGRIKNSELRGCNMLIEE